MISGRVTNASTGFRTPFAIASTAPPTMYARQPWMTTPSKSRFASQRAAAFGAHARSMRFSTAPAYSCVSSRAMRLPPWKELPTFVGDRVFVHLLHRGLADTADHTLLRDLGAAHEERIDYIPSPWRFT